MIEAPIFHCNGDDPEAVVYAAKIAIEFRQKFHKPVVIDMFCYRRFGHNEGDEPAFTQPLMYQHDRRASRRRSQIYGERLVAEGLMTARVRRDEGRVAGDSSRPSSRPARVTANKADWLDGALVGPEAARVGEEPRRGDTGVAIEKLKRDRAKLTKAPEDFHVHRPSSASSMPAARRSRAARDRLGDGRGAGLRHASDRGLSGPPSGQDVERGTFSQRHAVLSTRRPRTLHAA